MKTKGTVLCLFVLMALIAFSGCKKEDDNGADVRCSEWFTSGTWAGASGEWYFFKSETEITQDIIDNGVVLAYAKLTSDGTNVRPLPAETYGFIWNYLIPSVGQVKFTTNILGTPTPTNSFRYIIIPGTTKLKSARINSYDINELKNMPYSDVCRLLGISE